MTGAAFVPLAPASDWHRAPLARQLVADMHALAAMTERYLVLARGEDAAFAWDETADAIGTIETDAGFTWRMERPRIAASGLVQRLLDRLVSVRDAWIDAEFNRVRNALGLPPVSEESDELFDEIETYADTVETAVRHSFLDRQGEPA